MRTAADIERTLRILGTNKKRIGINTERQETAKRLPESEPSRPPIQPLVRSPVRIGKD